MANSTATLSVRIIGDATSAVTALGSVDGSAKSMQASIDKAAAASGLALAAIGAGATVAANAASDAEQAAGGVDAVFGQYASRVQEWASKASTAVGLSKTDYSTLATIIGSQLKNMGLSLDESAGQTQNLIGLGADLAATYGGTTADAVDALSSLLRGERDPIERYGVSINQAAVDAEKAALGLAGLTGEADKNANLQATLSLLTKQTADAQGGFGREVDTTAHKQQVANAQMEDAIAKLGEGLLPLYSTGADLLGAFAGWVGENTTVVGIFVGVLGGFAAIIVTISAAMKVFAAVQAIQTAAQWASNAAWLASPITWIVLAIIAAIALIVVTIVIVVQHWDQFKRNGEDALNAVGDAVQPVISWVQNLLDWIGRAAAAIGDLFSGGGFGGFQDLFAQGFEASVSAVPAEAPTARAVRAPALPRAGDLADRGRAGDTYNIDIRIDGALDANAVGRQVEGVVNRVLQTKGAQAVGRVSWQS